MKSVLITLLFLFSTNAILGQNKNVKDETKTTTTTDTITNKRGCLKSLFFCQAEFISASLNN